MIILNSRNTFIKFVLVGIFNTIIGYAIFSLFIWFGLHYVWAILIATIIGVLFNFKTIGRWVFGSNNNKLIYKFIITYAIAYLINIFVLKILLSFSMNVYIAGAFAMGVASLFSYFLNREFVFKEIRREIN